MNLWDISPITYNEQIKKINPMIVKHTASLLYSINYGTENEKTVQAFSPKQAAVCFCKGGQSRGGSVYFQGKAYTDNADIAVFWSRYNELLKGLENAVEVDEAPHHHNNAHTRDPRWAK